MTSSLEHADSLPLNHFFSGSQCLLRLKSHLCFLVELTSAMRSASNLDIQLFFSLYIQDYIFKRNHIYMSYGESDHIVYYQNLDLLAIPGQQA